MTIRFEDMRSPQIGALAEKGAVVIVPIGACEEHGRHLPVGTDTAIAHRAVVEAAERVAGSPPVAVLPPSGSAIPSPCSRTGPARSRSDRRF